MDCRRLYAYELLLWLLCLSSSAVAQSSLSGDLQTDLKVFMRDSAIGAINTPQYDYLLSGLDGWLTVNYVTTGFDARLRLDVFNNSNLQDPNQAFTGAGIGYFHLSKQIEKLQVTGGYFYEQFGGGMIYRAYEDRGLGLDYATFGLNLKYKLTENWQVKGIAGQQKNRFSRYAPVIKGLNTEATLSLGSSAQVVPGAAFLNRTLDKATMDIVAGLINSYEPEDRFVPRYNVYAFSGYYTLYAGPVTWYVEGAAKTPEAILGAEGILVNKPGSIGYTSLNYVREGLGLTLQFKRTENFELRISPLETLLNGVLNFLPPMARQNSLRLPARYSPATQFLGEQAFQADLTYSPAEPWVIDVNFSHINDLDGNKLWREVYAQADVTASETDHLLFGGQYIFYNQQVYLSEPLPDQTALTAFVEYTRRLSQMHSLRTEVQYMHTEQDFGSFLFVLAEYNMAPRWSFSISDMYNIQPNPEKTTTREHYYNFFVSYTQGPTRFALAFARQVAGINCSGGVCRYEPAFNGVKCSITTSF
ncbi:MAG: DUF6029 family protein [Chitinophagales bacterium]|nr:DUF6029 family protein [Chitinophagales bacterium]MDW8393520.1 DUF6029 family protein [Chitinophagales bacterium]